VSTEPASPAAAEPAPVVARGPILAPPGGPPAAANRPESGLDDERVHVYESNPAPWWIGLLWVSFFLFGAIYLVVNLLR
jgi:hypothetical protein